jgi:hypothetical protein
MPSFVALSCRCCCWRVPTIATSHCSIIWHRSPCRVAPSSPG